MESKPECVLLDTNIWVQNLLLRTTLGSALLYAIKRSGAKLALPEVVEQEVTKHTVRAAQEAIEAIEKGFTTIASIMGFHKPYEVPKADEIEEAVRKRFAELDAFIVRVPFVLEHAKAGLRRVNERIPPSSTKQQQFKDCAIWEAALSLAKDYHVHLVSKDGDFYQDTNRSVLNKRLSEECDRLGVTITAYPDLKLCVAKLSKAIPALDKSAIAEQIYKSVAGQISEYAARHDIKPSDVERSDIKAFRTETPNKIAIEYCINVAAIDTLGEPNEAKQNPTICVSGGCKYDLDTQAILENAFDEIRYEWRDLNGNVGSKGDVFLRGTIGRQRIVPYTDQEEIEDS